MKSEEVIGTTIAFIGLALVLITIFALPFLFLACLPFFGLYVFWRLRKDSPQRQEAESRRHTEELYQKTLDSVGEPIDDGDLYRRLYTHIPNDTPKNVYIELIKIGEDIFRAENLTSDIPKPPSVCNSVDGGRYRDMLARLGAAGSNPRMVDDTIELIAVSLGAFAKAIPRLDGDVMVPASYMVPNLGQLVSDVLMPYYGDEYGSFKRIRETLQANLNATTPRQGEAIFPDEYDGDDVVDVYLKNTPLARFFDIPIPFEIPEEKRIEHQFVIGRSGQGKTQALSHYILKDIQDVVAGKKSVVVIDSQGDLINLIKMHEDLHEGNCVIIDPTDVEFPTSLNLFDVKMDRLNTYSPLAKERQLNAVIELYDYVLGKLLAAEMTSKQDVAFQFVIQLMLAIPNANIFTMVELFEDGGAEKYQEHIDTLDPAARSFFEKIFKSKAFNSTREEVSRRIYGILKIGAIARMFAAEKSKLDMFEEMNSAKVILINTSLSLLQPSGTELFGRFFIALITAAAMEREEIPEKDRLPTHVFIDEASDYEFDENIDRVLTQARKYNVGLVLATQYMEKIDGKLKAAIAANTGIKFAGGVSAQDANRMNDDMRCSKEFIMDRPPLEFAAFVQGITNRAIPMKFEYGKLADHPKMSEEAFDKLLTANRARYCTPVKKVDTRDSIPEPIIPEPDEDSDPDEPSSTL